MKTQLKRLLALNLAIIMLLCAVFPASAAGTAAQPAADAQPQQTAQPTEDSTQPRYAHPHHQWRNPHHRHGTAIWSRLDFCCHYER